MIRSFIRYLKGYVKIQVEGYSPERFLNMCCFHRIFIWGLKPVGNAYEMYMSIAGLKKVRPFVKKTHTRIRIKDKYGFPFFLKRYRKRKLFFAGLLLCLMLIWTYSLFIWDIHFEGNEKWTDEVLTEFLSTQNVSCGMKKSEVDCSGIVKAIRREYNDIVWVSASIDGSRLKIQIKENEDTFVLPGKTREEKEQQDTSGQDSTETGDIPQKEGEENPTDLIAKTDGIVTGIVTRSGVPQVHVGDQVKAGDILVSGRIEVMNDSKEVIGYEYVRADADVFADTQMDYSDSMPLTYQEKLYDGKEKYQFYARIFDWTVSVGSVKNKYKNSELYTKETQLKMGENFYLPFSVGWKQAKSYALKEKKYTKEELQKDLTRDFNQFCEELEEKGIQIRENDVKIQLDKNSANASGTLYLNERITEEAATEILTIERNEPNESVGTDD